MNGREIRGRTWAGYIYLWAGAVMSFFSLREWAEIAQNGF
jgi:hypothetical protein